MVHVFFFSILAGGNLGNMHVPSNSRIMEELGIIPGEATFQFPPAKGDHGKELSCHVRFQAVTWRKSCHVRLKLLPRAFV